MTAVLAPQTAHDWFAQLLDVVGSQPIGGRLRQCPAHRDPTPSLSVSCGADGRVLVKCHAGCPLDKILSTLRCSSVRLNRPAPMPPAQYAVMTGLRIEFPPAVLHHGHPSSRGYRLEAVHPYGDGTWVLERWRSRGGQKDLMWETIRNGQRIPGLLGVPLHRLPLYRERELRQGMALGDPVLIVESESSVDALKGYFATTWAGGASAVNVRRLVGVLGDHAQTVVIPDHDEAGLRVLDRLAAAGLASHVLLPGAGQDARDLYRDLGPQAFAAAVAETVTLHQQKWSTAE